MNWLGHEGLRFVQILNERENGKGKTCAGLFEVLSEKFKLQHKKAILLMQYLKLIREQNENAKENGL